jgi:hypothetical protein
MGGGYYTTPVPAVAQATYITAGTGRGLNVAEFVGGVLHIYCARRTSPTRIFPSWQEAIDGNLATGGRYATIKSYATSIRATGLSIMTLPAIIGPWGRVSWTMPSGNAIKITATLAGKATW